MWIAAALLVAGGGIGAFIALDGSASGATGDGNVATEQPAAGDHGFRSPIGDNRYVNGAFGYTIDLPDGFSASADANSPGMVTAPGLFGGKMAVVVGVAMEIDPNLLGQEGMRAAAENIASGFGGTVVSVELKRIQGKDLYTGIYDMSEGMRMEVVLYPGSGYVLAVAFGTLRGEFDASASARIDLFERRVELP
jgi:hypothetical protein